MYSTSLSTWMPSSSMTVSVMFHVTSCMLFSRMHGMIYLFTQFTRLVRNELEQHNVFHILFHLDAKLQHDCKCYVPRYFCLFSVPKLHGMIYSCTKLTLLVRNELEQQAARCIPHPRLGLPERQIALLVVPPPLVISAAVVEALLAKIADDRLALEYAKL